MSKISLLAAELQSSKIIQDTSGITIEIGSVTDLKQFLKIVKKQLISYSVISSGKNWGYKRDKGRDHITLNLHKLNKIKRYDETFGAIVVEPGVTFQQVTEFLKKKKSSFYMPVTGGPVEGSIVATISQRGIARGLYGNLFDNCTNLEVILKDGNIINTGFGSYKNSKLRDIAKHPAGPIKTGLYTQSADGIILSASILLAPIASYISIYTFTLTSDHKLEQFINTVRTLKLRGYMRGNFLVGNIYRFLANETQYPWEKMKHKTPLSNKVLMEVAQNYGLKGEWMGEHVIEAYDLEELNIQKRIIAKEFEGILDTIQFIDSDDIRRLKLIKEKASSAKKEKINAIIDSFENSLFKGVPNNISLKSLYWRKKMKVPNHIDPDRDACGVIWFNSILPLDGKEVVEMVNKVKKIIVSYKFEPNIGFNFVSDRVLYLIGVILFDKSNSLEDAQAKECFQNVMSMLEQNGFYPYRTSQ